MTAGDVIVEAQTVFLNDAGGGIYPSTVLLSFVQKAWDDLEQELQSNGVTEIKEVTSALSVPINTPILNGVAGFPADVLDPIELSERPAGGTIDQWKLMRQLEWEPTVVPTGEIRYWDYREGEIKINPSTAAREVLLKYIKSLPPITSTSTVITIPSASAYLSARTAELAAGNIGENPNRAAVCKMEADVALAKCINIMIKQNQSIPVRRRRFKPFKRSW